MHFPNKILMQRLGLLLLALLAGMVLPVQSGLNAQIGRTLGHAVLAAILSTVVGAGALVLLAALSRLPVPTLLTLRCLPAWAWLPGVLGAIYVLTVVLLIPRLGAVLTFALVVGGQLLVSLLLDHYGVLGLTERPLNGGRLAGVALLILGILLIRRY